MNALDSPQVSTVVFHPRGEDYNYSPTGIPTKTRCENAEISGYLHLNEESDALLLFFHGNGEIAADYDELAPVYLSCGVSCWIVDYRGYGNSTGTPAFSYMFTDAEAFLNDIPRLRDLAGKSFRHVLVMGRSLGSASAIYLASTHPQELDGLILDSPFANGLDLIHRLGGPRLTPSDLTGFEDNIDRMAQCDLPSLIIHGTNDFIIPFSDAMALYRVCRSKTKRLVEIQGAGHNDLLYRGLDTYVSEMRQHIDRITASGQRAPA